MADYRFLTRFHLAAPIDGLHRRLLEPEPWLEHEPHVRRLVRLHDGAADGTGRRFGVEMRAVTPYRLRCEIEIVEVVSPSRIVWLSTGDLAGRGTWTMEPTGDGTAVAFLWQVRTTPLWMRMAGSVARRLFVWNHNRAMEEAAAALGRAVGAEVRGFAVLDQRSRS